MKIATRVKMYRHFNHDTAHKCKTAGPAITTHTQRAVQILYKISPLGRAFEINFQRLSLIRAVTLH